MDYLLLPDQFSGTESRNENWIPTLKNASLETVKQNTKILGTETHVSLWH